MRNEEQLEKYFIEQLVKLGWKYIPGNKLPRTGTDEPLIISDLLNVIRKFNKHKNITEDEFNSLFDEEVVWNELPNAKVTSVNIKNYVEVFDENDWPNQHEWLRVNLEKFSKFFRPKIKSL